MNKIMGRHYTVLNPAGVVIESDFTVVFLHEALGSIPQWKAFPQQLCDLLGVLGIVYERQGHGQSDGKIEGRTSAYLHEAAYFELQAFIQAMLPNKNYVLVGHSDGASIALLHAAKYPNQCVGVISMAAHVFVEKETLAGIYPAIEAFEKGRLKPALEKYHHDKTEALFYAWSNTWLSADFAHWNIEKEINSIQCPVLAIQGVDDQYGTEEQLDAIQRAIGSNRVEKLWLPNCGHAPHLEASDAVLKATKVWVDAQIRNTQS